jgi:hypothetical protein
MLACGWVGRRRQAGRRQEEEKMRRGGGMEGWKDGWKARKAGEPWREGGSRAGAWVFYEVKSVVR